MQFTLHLVASRTQLGSAAAPDRTAACGNKIILSQASGLSRTWCTCGTSVFKNAKLQKTNTIVLSGKRHLSSRISGVDVGYWLSAPNNQWTGYSVQGRPGVRQPYQQLTKAWPTHLMVECQESMDAAWTPFLRFKSCCVADQETLRHRLFTSCGSDRTSSGPGHGSCLVRPPDAQYPCKKLLDHPERRTTASNRGIPQKPFAKREASNSEQLNNMCIGDSPWRTWTISQRSG